MAENKTKETKARSYQRFGETHAQALQRQVMEL